MNAKSLKAAFTGLAGILVATLAPGQSSAQTPSGTSQNAFPFVFSDQRPMTQDQLLELRLANAKAELEAGQAVAQYLESPTDANYKRASQLYRALKSEFPPLALEFALDRELPFKPWRDREAFERSTLKTLQENVLAAEAAKAGIIGPYDGYKQLAAYQMRMAKREQAQKMRSQQTAQMK